jgi:hypothetical protein
VLPLINQVVSYAGLDAALRGISTRRVGRRTETAYEFELYYPIIFDQDFEINEFFQLMRQALVLVGEMTTDVNRHKFGVRVRGRTNYMQVPFQDYDTVMDALEKVIEKLDGTYSEDGEFMATGFEILTIPFEDDRILALSGKYGVKMVGGDCYISPESIHNCGFICMGLGVRTIYKIRDEDIKYLLHPKGLKDIGSSYKQKYPEYSGAEGCTKEMFTAMAKRENVRLKIYGTDLTKLYLDVPGPATKLVEMCYYGGHVCLIIRKEKFIGIQVEREEKLNKYYKMIGEETYVERMFLSDLMTKKYGTDAWNPKMMEAFLQCAQTAYPIRKMFPAKTQKKLIGAWDIESTNKNDAGVTFDQKPYCCEYAYYSDKLKENPVDPRTPYEPVLKLFKGFDCLKRMFKSLYEEGEVINGYTMYAHNAGKFDHQVLMQHGLFELDDWDVTALQCRAGKIMKIELLSKDKKLKVKLLDSLSMLSGSLKDLLKECGTEHQKLDFDHSKVTLENCLEQDGLDDYQHGDVLGLLELMSIFADTVWKEMKINITDCLTAASLAKRNFLQNYYPKSKAFVYRLPRLADQYVRNGYNGGRVEAFKIGYLKGKYYYYDVTSLYPAEMRQKMPCDKPIVVTREMLESGERTFWQDCAGKKVVHRSIYGFARVKVRGPAPGKRPLHSLFTNNKLLFPVFDAWTETVLFTEEIRLAMMFDLGYEYEVLDFMSFTPIPILKKTVEDGFRLKAEQAALNNSTSANLYKIIINSTYGFWGLVVDELDNIGLFKSGGPIDPDDMVNAMIVENRYRSYLEINGYHLIRGKYDLRVEDFNVAIAAAVTSYSRSCLYQIMTDFEKDGAKVYYTDTDSVIVDKSIKDCPTVLAKFQQDGCGDALGSLKNEAVAILKKRWIVRQNRPDMYQKEVEAEAEPYFDEICLLGCKNYALRRAPRFEGGAKIEILKMKGVNKDKPVHAIITPEGEEQELNPPRYLTFDDYILLSRDYKLKQLQSQFKAGFGTMMDHEKQGGSRIIEVVKKLSKSYDKGLLKLESTTTANDGSQCQVYNVLPIVISDVTDKKRGKLLHDKDRFPNIELEHFEIKDFPNSDKPSVKRYREQLDDEEDF